MHRNVYCSGFCAYGMHWWEESSKRDHEDVGGGGGLDSSGLALGPVVGSRRHSSKHFVYIECWAFIE
jgi:hypothetical protein